MSSDLFSTLSGITGFIVDVIYPILFISFGFFMLLTPYDKYQKIFPVSFSKKAIKACGVFLITAGVIYGILLVTGLSNSGGTGSQNETDSETVTQFTSEDGSVTIEAHGQWEQEDCTAIVGDESYSWLAAGWIMLTGKNDDLFLIAQYQKNVFNIHNLDDLKETFSSSYPSGAITDIKQVDNPTVSQMEVLETDTGKLTDKAGTPGELLILYGETEYACYIILYANPKKIDDAGTALFHQVCASFKETPPETEAAAPAELSETLQWFNNTFAVLLSQNGWDLSLYGGLPHDESGKSMAEYLLASAWDVTDRESADQTLDWLLEEGHRTSLTEELDALAGIGLSDVPADERTETILANFELDEEQAQRYADWFALYEEYDTDTAAGWDYSRAMMLLSFYYQTGLYTEEEALDKSLEVAKTIQSTFDSWDSFMESYFVGYEYWSEESGDERRKIYESLKSSSDNPFLLDWNTTLKKSW